MNTKYKYMYGTLEVLVAIFFIRQIIRSYQLRQVVRKSPCYCK